MRPLKAALAVSLLAGMLAAPAQADGHLTERHMRELLAFAANAGLGFSLKPEHVQVPESMHTVYGAVGNGLRVLGQPCAEVSQIEAPQSGNSYRVTCRLAAGDEATVSYRLNPIARTEKNGDSSLLPAKVLLYYKVL